MTEIKDQKKQKNKANARAAQLRENLKRRKQAVAPKDTDKERTEKL
jgi:hypothetical protein